MKLSITLIAALLGAVSAFPAELHSDVDLANPNLSKRDCVPSSWWKNYCDDPGAMRCVCNQGKSASALPMHCIMIYANTPLRSVYANSSPKAL
jgi:hypothetical protein